MGLLAGMAIAGGAQLLTGAAQSIIGGINKRKGREEVERLMANQPQFETPESVGELSELYGDYLRDIESRETLPGQAGMESQLRESTARGVRDVRETARSSTEALGATTDIASREIESLQQFEIEAARQQARQELQATQMYGQALSQEAQYEAQAWKYNEWMPWRTKVASAQGRGIGGQQTLQAGIGNMVSGATQFGTSALMGGLKNVGGGDSGSTTGVTPSWGMA